ncbi:MAG TPA: aminotransferase class I/II-fold pyridoxal phosphate-dependent enzyme [Rhizomicrobium sp.]|nr:aminotransferase class I/II-fold pyridoxal phosphate-dependent enzyme [Rhizomicrobium sp.]
MTKLISEEAKDDLLGRGYSRRQMMRAAMMFSGAAAATAFTLSPEMAVAQQDLASAKVRIGQNECWTGPMPPGAAAAAAAIPVSNRYSPNDEQGKLVKAISQIENVPEDHIMTWPGSNEALARSVVAFCSPTKSLVQADPSYETCGRAAKFLNVPIKNVPLTADYRHDVKAMAAADPNAGVMYVVNPNNPTGTMTPNAEIEWIVANKPAGSVVVIDEAYIHWTSAYPNNTTSHLAAAGKDVLIMRTFSKIFGMAGMRIGYTMGRPDLLAKLRLHDGGALSRQLPVPSAACATASLGDKATFASRRKTLVENRAMTVDFLTKRGLKLIGPSEANMLMIDWKTKTAKEMQAAFRAQGVEIARVFPTWPTVSRISIGSKQDMEGFFSAFNKIVQA